MVKGGEKSRVTGESDVQNTAPLVATANGGHCHVHGRAVNETKQVHLIGGVKALTLHLVGKNSSGI